MNTLQKNSWYYICFTGQYYLLQYQENTFLGHQFKSDNDTIFASNLRIAAENPVLWKVKK